MTMLPLIEKYQILRNFQNDYVTLNWKVPILRKFENDYRILKNIIIKDTLFSNPTVSVWLELRSTADNHFKPRLLVVIHGHLRSRLGCFLYDHHFLWFWNFPIRTVSRTTKREQNIEGQTSKEIFRLSYPDNAMGQPAIFNSL